MKSGRSESSATSPPQSPTSITGSDQSINEYTDMNSHRSPTSPASPISLGLDSEEDWTGTGSSSDSNFFGLVCKLHENTGSSFISHSLVTPSAASTSAEENVYMQLTPLTRNQDSDCLYMYIIVFVLILR